MAEIILKNITKEYENGFQAVKNVNLEIKDNEFVILVGPSGCGKSTTLRMIAGLEDISDGELLIDGEVVNDVAPQHRDIAMVFQNYALYPHMTVYQNIAYSLKLKKVPKNEIDERVHNVAQSLGLEELLDRRPGQLSGGQKQRVAIARALVLEPKILLCDEATSALDPAITREILSLLQKINKELGITMLIVTHQMEVVKQICERVSFLKDGKVLAEGKPEDLFIHPTKEIKAFLQEESSLLPNKGVNIQLFFTDKSSDPVITMMARDLNIDFSICWGKLEDFRDNVYGSLVININKEDEEKVKEYLDKEGVVWEVLNND